MSANSLRVIFDYYHVGLEILARIAIFILELIS